MSTLAIPRVIPTVYDGTGFRSRLEARWAVFLDQLGIRWIYEPDAIADDARAYLPDFLLPDLGCFLEVKPFVPRPYGAEAEKWRLLVDFYEQPLYIMYGPPGLPTAEDHAHVLFPDMWDSHYRWCDCQTCGRLGIEFEGRAARLCECDPGDRNHRVESPRLRAAAEASRRQRFDGALG